MKTIEIIGKNYSGKWSKTRVASRGIIIDGEKILLSYEAKIDQWMLPGGGLENEESEKDCCIREVAEETGMIVDVSDCKLVINEYYGDCKWVSKYFICKIVGNTEVKLTQTEIEHELTSKWITVKEAKDIFSKYNLYNEENNFHYGLYLREYTALKELT